MTIFGYAFSALAPWLLLGAPLGAAILVWAYRYRGTANEVVISTFLLVRRLPELMTARKRFSPPPQFWLELAIVALLSLAAAGISAMQAGEKIAIVLDSSLSMLAKEPSGGTRFESAARIASADAVQRFARSRFTVFTAAASLQRASESGISGPAAALAIRGLKPTLSPDRLDSAIYSLLNDGSYDSVWVYTDKAAPEGLMSLAKLKVTSIPTDTGATRNAWIRSVSSLPAGALSVDIGVVGPAPATARLTADCFDSSGVPVREHSGKTIQLSPASPTTVQLGPIREPWSYCSVSVQGLSAGEESLLVDNEAWVTSDSAGSTIRVVSPLTPDELGLPRIQGYSFERISPEALPSLSAGAAVIFHRTAPPPELTASSLVVMPPTGPLGLSGSVGIEASGTASVTRWSSSHPLLQYLNPTLLSISRVRPLRCPELSQQILSSSAGDLVCAGEDRSGRLVVTGFEIFPFDGLLSPTVSIFTLNALKWIAQVPSTASGAVGPATLPEGATNVRYLAPSAPPPEQQGDSTFDISTPGIIAFSPQGGPDSQIRAFNIFSDEESNLSDTESLSVSLASVEPQARARAPFACAPWFALIAWLLLAIDIARRAIRASAWGAR